MYYMQINKNFVHQVGDQPRFYDARSTNHQGKKSHLVEEWRVRSPMVSLEFFVDMLQIPVFSIKNRVLYTED